MLASALNAGISPLYSKTTDQILEALRGPISKIAVDEKNAETSVRAEDSKIVLLEEEVARLSSADVDLPQQIEMLQTRLKAAENEASLPAPRGLTPPASHLHRHIGIIVRSSGSLAIDKDRPEEPVRLVADIGAEEGDAPPGNWVPQVHGLYSRCFQIQNVVGTQTCDLSVLDRATVVKKSSSNAYLHPLQSAAWISRRRFPLPSLKNGSTTTSMRLYRRPRRNQADHTGNWSHQHC